MRRGLPGTLLSGWKLQTLCMFTLETCSSVLELGCAPPSLWRNFSKAWLWLSSHDPWERTTIRPRTMMREPVDYEMLTPNHLMNNAFDKATLFFTFGMPAAEFRTGEHFYEMFPPCQLCSCNEVILHRRCH